MQIILAIVVGAAIGVGIHFQLTQRSTRGVAVGPMVGALAAAVAWTALTWSGVGTDSVWLWLSMIVAPIAVTYPTLIVLTRTRVDHDARERARLKIG